MALALYRKYRPQTLSDLVGQETNVTIIRNAARADKLGHAYLFYGSRGTGKTSTARLIAKLLNCEKRHENKKFHDEGEPCNACTSCQSIDLNNSLDVIEIDAASNRGIEEIRNLKENIRTAPATSRHKVYIIDEAHMLTGAAFNALLKTLEEPPAHAVFVLATTEYDKLPATITSRTQRFLFKKLPKRVILEKLKGIAKEEKIAIDNEALELVAAAGEGSLRDAESLLDQIRAAADTIDLKTAEMLTGRMGLKNIHTFATFIAKGDQKGSVAFLHKLNDEGTNMVELTRDLIHYLRKAISLKTNPDLEGTFKLELTDGEVAELSKLAATIDTQKGISFLKALIRSYSEMRYSPFASIPLEIALIEHLSS